MAKTLSASTKAPLGDAVAHAGGGLLAQRLGVEELDERSIDVRVASLHNLRRMKRAAGRPQDLEDLRQLDLAHGVPPS